MGNDFAGAQLHSEHQDEWTAILDATAPAENLYPMTYVVPKGLIPIYDKPLIYYSLSAAMLAGARSVFVVTTESDAEIYKTVLGNGRWCGIEIEYLRARSHLNLVGCLLLAGGKVGDRNACLIRADFLACADGFQRTIRAAKAHPASVTVLGQQAAGGSRDGASAKALGRSKVASLLGVDVFGLAFVRNQGIELIQTANDNAGCTSEFEVYRYLLERGELNVLQCGRGFAHLDTSTPSQINSASHFVAALESNHGFKIGCPEEIAYRGGQLSASKLLADAIALNNAYGDYLRSLLDDE